MLAGPLERGDVLFVLSDSSIHYGLRRRSEAKSVVLLLRLLLATAAIFARKAQAGVEITPSFFSYLYFGSEADSSYCGTRKVSSVQSPL